MRIRRVYSEDFAPFGVMDLQFPEVENPTRGGEVHILTGVNGTGKTRILAVLAAILGNGDPLIARSIWDRRTFRFESADGRTGVFDCNIQGLDWRSGRIADETIPAYAYNGEARIAVGEVTATMEPVKLPSRKAALGFSKPGDTGQILSQAIYNLVILGANDIRTYDSLEIAKAHSRPLRLLTRIEAILEKLTGRSVSFRPELSSARDSRRPTLLMVRWGTLKALPFELLPDGLRSILGWLVELAVMMDLHHPEEAEPWKQPLIVLLDEVERHLHPAWQRQVLPIAQEMFPNAQFFVATHSPFIISSLNEGWIHPLNLESDGTVTCDAPIPASEGDSYVSVMGSIMGVPEIYDTETEGLLADFRSLRTAALRREPGKKEEALALATKISERGTELGYMMEKEIARLENRLNGSH